MFSVIFHVTILNCLFIIVYMNLNEPSEADDFSMIPQYHLPMLNDKVRNHAYKMAIFKAVNLYQPRTAIDVGAGTSLLSLYAASAGVKEVIAIDRNELLVDIGNRIIRDNNFSNQVVYYNTDSDRVTHSLLYDACVELQMRKSLDFTSCTDRKNDYIDLVITEIFDGWIIGEFIFTALSDLYDSGVIDLSSRVIPSSGDLHAQLVQSVYSFHSPPDNTSIENFNFSAFEHYNVYTFNEIAITAGDLVSKHLSDPIRVFQLPFEPRAAFDELISNGYSPSKNTNPYYHDRYSHALFHINETTTAHGLLFWFDLWLDREMTIKLSNDPYGAKSHWKQMFLPFKQDFTVYKDTYLSLQIVQLPRRYVVLPNNSKQRLVKFVSKCPELKNEGIDIFTRHKLLGEDDDNDVMDITCHNDGSNFHLTRDQCPLGKLQKMRNMQQQRAAETPVEFNDWIFEMGGSLDEVNYWKGYIGQEFSAVVKLSSKQGAPSIEHTFIVPDDDYRYSEHCSTRESCNSNSLKLVEFNIYCSVSNR